MRSRRVWALAMNASEAVIVRGLQRSGEASEPELVLHAEVHKLRDVMADKPGRSFSSGDDSRRSAMEYGTDALRAETLAFVRRVLETLETARRSGDFEDLVVMAEPRVLGLLREEMSEHLRRLVVAERPKNLAHLAPEEIARLAAAEAYRP